MVTSPRTFTSRGTPPTASRCRVAPTPMTPRATTPSSSQMNHVGHTPRCQMRKRRTSGCLLALGTP
ncbi:hypothetical protein E2C01_102142 [Portunus trituberculatus]|uniref:Uncharacterized protein n=1 Tax=Portunus trituberculatus TaxID=210409 RepID=A0A5B7KHN7_PORTR|nr:hypothetical protein [Portunus trituberculatus]